MSPLPEGPVPHLARLRRRSVAHPARRPSPAAGRRSVGLACFAVLLAAADTYVVVLALPDIMAGVGLSLEELHRAGPIISAFLLGYITTLPLVGRLADLHGRVPVLVACLLVFAFGSLLTATADGLGAAVAGRALQGVGGGGLVPATLALVADVWPPHRRGVPLGAVGAAQEVGSVLGPLYGAALLAVSGWRAIFWVNLVAGLLLALVLLRAAPQRRAGEQRRPRPSVRVGWVLTAAAMPLLLLVALQPPGLTSSVTAGAVFAPLVGDVVWTSPLALAGVLLGLLGLASAVLADPWALANTSRAVDVTGAALLALALGGVVLAFAAADPTRQALADSAPELLSASAVAAALFLLRQRMASRPLVPRRALAHSSAWGAMLVNLFVGAALVVALVDVPVFARVTRYPDSQLSAALVLVQLLAALPVGALVGGWALSRVPPRWLTAFALALCAAGFVAMAGWDERALYGASARVALVATGFGFGLAIAPVNAALLAATDSAVHGVASALVVVARMVGMLTGLSVLTAVGLRVFYRDQAQIGTPMTLCPESPENCPAYEAATRSAVVHELSVMFSGAAVSAVVGALLAALLLTSTSSHGRFSRRKDTSTGVEAW